MIPVPALIMALLIFLIYSNHTTTCTLQQGRMIVEWQQRWLYNGVSPKVKPGSEVTKSVSFDVSIVNILQWLVLDCLDCSGKFRLAFFTFFSQFIKWTKIDKSKKKKKKIVDRWKLCSYFQLLKNFSDKLMNVYQRWVWWERVCLNGWLKQWFSKWDPRTPRGPRGAFIIPLVKRGIIYFYYNTIHN